MKQRKQKQKVEFIKNIPLRHSKIGINELFFHSSKILLLKLSNFSFSPIICIYLNFIINQHRFQTFIVSSFLNLYAEKYHRIFVFQIFFHFLYLMLKKNFSIFRCISKLFFHNPILILFPEPFTVFEISAFLNFNYFPLILIY